MDITGNPSSQHAEGRASRAEIETARVTIGDACNVDPERIVFTSGATEAAAAALAGRNLRSSPIEHACVLAWTEPSLPVRSDGSVHVEEPEASTLQVANGETGIVQQLPQSLAVSDATQAFGKLPVGNAIHRADVAFVSSHKIGGPKGVGALIMREGAELCEVIKGGGQEFGRRSGTENVVGIAGFGAAVAAAIRDLADGIWERIESLRDLLEEALISSGQKIIFFGRDSVRLPNTSCFAAPGWKGETQVMRMDLEGFSVSAGAACSSGRVRPSGVLEALGADKVTAVSAIRISLGSGIEKDDVLRFADAWTAARQRHFDRRASAGNTYIGSGANL